MSAGRVVFVTTELQPETAGGAGVVVDGLARRLAPGRAAAVVLCHPAPIALADRPGVDTVPAEIPTTGFLARSEAAARAVAAVARPGDRIEVQDFEGLGFWMLAHRSELGLEGIPVTVRFHGPYDLLAGAMDTPPADWAVPRAMEHGAFEMADAVLVPAAGHIPALRERYGIPDGRLVLAPPPVPDLAGRLESGTDRLEVAAVGRLGEMKGSQDLVRAAIALLDGGLDLRVRFVGDDGWSTTAAAPMSVWLGGLIPERHREAIRFMGPVPRPDLPEALDGVTAVVVPSRFESFCLAAHEARRLGLPVVVPDLPAFRGTFSEESGALVYDGSVEGLATALRRLGEDPDLARRLAGRPLPEPGDPLAAYAMDPEPRHPRAQAGLATAAVKRVEGAAAREAGTPTGGALVQRALRHLPAPVARTVARLAPRSLKDRVRAVASWPEEQARRARVTRLRAVEERIAGGGFPELEEPDVTVVIPVYDQGRFLPEALASVYEQVHPSWEVVVVDDGSTDPETVALLDSLEYPRLRLVRQGNRGLPAARNAGMGIARGRFLVPLDADDELHPEFLARLIPALEEEPGAAYAHCHARLYGDVDAIWVTRPFNPYWQLLGNGVVGCVLLRTEAWRAAGGYDESMTSGNEDWELWLRLQKAGWGQVQVPLPLFRYRKHGVSMSVATEARFEEGRRMVRDRHPELYTREALGEIKQSWYPLMTVIGRPGTPVPTGAELVPGPEDLASTWGKFVVDLRGSESAGPDLLMRMAAALESAPDVALAHTTGNPPLTMVRRWNLHDPDAGPRGEVVIEDPAAGAPLAPGAIPRPGWTVPAEARQEEVPVQRQRPEESGWAPDPEAW